MAYMALTKSEKVCQFNVMALKAVSAPVASICPFRVL